MDENELLLRHAERWAEQQGRTLDVELVDHALRLRSVHDGLAANKWPQGSVTHLMLERWPAHGPLDPPDVPALVNSLETFWRFLRNTGRMAGGSVEPSALVKEAKAAGRRMAAACADLAKFGPSKQMFAFGREIGISIDDVPTVEELNDRVERIQNAWNALPQEERWRRSPQSTTAGSRMSQAFTEVAGHVQQHGELPQGWALPEPPRLDDVDEDQAIRTADPATTAPLYRASSFVNQVLALCEWVGEGREVTATDVLRPAVAKRAYAELGLWNWERQWVTAAGLELPTGKRMEAALAVEGLSDWRTAADCLPLDRLWLAALNSGLITIRGKKARFDRAALPQTDEQWVRLAHFFLMMLARIAEHEAVLDPLLGVLYAIGGDNSSPRNEAELAQLWWDTPINPWAETTIEHAGRYSDNMLMQCLAMFGDTGAWTTLRGKLTGTEIARDLMALVISALENGVLTITEVDD